MKNMSKIFLRTSLFVLALCLATVACKKSFLEIDPTASLTEETLSTKKGLDGLLIGCYSTLTGRASGFYSGFGNWVHGSVLGGEANKGSNDGDQAVVQPVQRYETLPDNGLPAEKWRNCYEGVARCNTLLRLATASTDPTVTEDVRKQLIAEARFLRGFYYFELRRIFGNVPYVDETMLPEDAILVKNDKDIYPQIEADLTAAAADLPETQSAIGRVNKWAAKAYLAKALLYQKKYAEALPIFNDVITNGKTSGGQGYGLLNNYADVFKSENDNSKESIFSAQAAVNTGSIANSNSENVLNFPYNTGSDGPAGCCGFFQPSFELANSFRTDANGLPLLDGSYNTGDNQLVTDFGLNSTDPFTPDAGPVDPRLDHSVGRRGIPYLDWIIHPGYNWIRDQTYGGPYSPKKFIFYKGTAATYTDGSSWTRGYTAINQPLMRFADVLLMTAECEIEAGSMETARALVNQVRERASAPQSFVKLEDGTNAANYVIGLYNTPWTDKATANAAVRMERKLELSGEGHRLYDLVRWEVAAETLNAYLAYDGAKLVPSLGGATFTAGKNELYPIPQSQIDIQGPDVLKQNPGY